MDGLGPMGRYRQFGSGHNLLGRQESRSDMRRTITILAIFSLAVFVFTGYVSYLYVQEDELSNVVENLDLRLNNRIISLYIDDLPNDVDPRYANSMREALSEWEKLNPGVTFRESDQDKADVLVFWVKEFGGNLGHAINRNVIEIGLGDSLCLGKYKPYTYETTLWIAQHEIGHVLGFEHSSNPLSVMFREFSPKYLVDVDETEVLPDGWVKFYPTCTRRATATYSFEVISDQELDIYIVPSQEEVDHKIDGKLFHHYPQCKGEQIRFYKETCTIPSEGGILIIDPIMDGKDTRFTIKIMEN